jgi:sugar transferase (PEP-CTERM system associated)
MIRVFNHYLSLRLLMLSLVEGLVLFNSVIIGFEMRAVPWNSSLPLGEAFAFTVVVLIMMSALGLYQSVAETFRSTVQRVIVAYGLSLIIMSVLFYLVPATYLGRGVFALTSVIAITGVLLVRYMFFSITDIGLPRRRVLVVGNGSEAEEVISFLHEGGRARTIEYAGMYAVMAERDADEAQRRLNHEQLQRTVRDLRVSEIVVAVRERRGGVLPLRHLLDCKLNGVKVMGITSFYERELGMLKLDNLRASWLIFGDGFDSGATRDVVKRIFDIFASLAILLLTAPLLLGGMLAVFLESGRPLFYRQERIGEGGRPFSIIKLRSMVVDAEKPGAPQWAKAGDARVTRVGRFIRKTRIDELPQLFNVLRGDMSFVGPRPERQFFIDQLVKEIPYYDVRHSVKPGITGWSQVRYPYGASVQDSLNKLQYDLYYVKNHSLFLDLLIMVETVQVVLLGKGAR